jgi:predicted nucleotidyltransferase
MTREEAEKYTILRCEVGSTAHGVSVGNDDRDEMGILIEPIEEAMGIGAPFEQFIHRDATVRTGKHDAPSEPGDLDLTLYSLRKWVRLALKGNPTILSMLFAPVLSTGCRGDQLRELAPLIISRQVGSQYLGYMQSQRYKMLGEKCNRVKRPDLVEKFGFDTKFAYHMLRLGFQGTELLSTGKFTMPITGWTRDFLLKVREGKIAKDVVLHMAERLEDGVKRLMESGPLREKPDQAAVERWMIRLYIRAWGAQRKLEDILEDYTIFYRKKFEELGR